MDSDDDGFAKQGGDAIELGDDFESEEEADEMPRASDDAMRGQMSANIATSGPAGGANAAKPADVKGEKVED